MGSWEFKYHRYKAYMTTVAWANKRRQVLERDSHECQICGRCDATNVHHLTYSSVGNEPLHHLVTLCTDCHHAIHYDESGKRRKNWKRFNPKPVRGRDSAIPAQPA